MWIQVRTEWCCLLLMDVIEPDQLQNNNYDHRGNALGVRCVSQCGTAVMAPLRWFMNLFSKKSFQWGSRVGCLFISPLPFFCPQFASRLHQKKRMPPPQLFHYSIAPRWNIIRRWKSILDCDCLPSQKESLTYLLIGSKLFSENRLINLSDSDKTYIIVVFSRHLCWIMGSYV